MEDWVSHLPYLALWVETPTWMQAQEAPPMPRIDPSLWKWGPPES